MGELGFFGLFLATGGALLGLLLGPVGVAIGRRLGGQPEKTPGSLSTGEMAAERVSQLEERVHELEERLDFAERMIAQGSGERALPPAGGEAR